MKQLHPEYVVNESQERKAVLLPVAEWEHVLSEPCKPCVADAQVAGAVLTHTF